MSHDLRPSSVRHLRPSSVRHVAPHARGTTVAEAVAAYRLARTDWSPATAVRNREILDQFAWLAAQRQWPAMEALAVGEVRAFLAYLNEPGPRWGSDHRRAAAPLSAATKNKMGAVVRTFLRWCVEEGIADPDVAKNVRWPQAPKMTDSMRTIEGEEFARLLGACDQRAWHGVRDAAILTLLYDTGLRRGELLAMRVSDVAQADRSSATVTGKSGTRAVGMGTTARRAVRAYLERCRAAVQPDHDALWVTRAGTPLGGRGVDLLVQRAARNAGITGRVYPHKLRHSFATEYLRNGGNGYSLQMALGHTSTVVTSHYVHLVAADVEESMRRFSPADHLKKRKG